MGGTLHPPLHAIIMTPTLWRKGEQNDKDGEDQVEGPDNTVLCRGGKYLSSALDPVPASVSASVSVLAMVPFLAHLAGHTSNDSISNFSDAARDPFSNVVQKSRQVPDASSSSR